MRMQLSDALSVGGVIESRVSAAIRHVDYFDLHGDASDRNSGVMFFPTRSDGADGWYPQTFNRSVMLSKLVAARPDWIFVLEKGSLEHFRPRNFVVVQSITDYLLSLSKHSRLRANPAIFAITGSVGKSTLVRMISGALTRSSSCDTIRARRVTPLIVFDHLLNGLGPKSRNLVVETGLYERDHVRELVAILNPTHGVLLNAYEMHTGRPGLANIADVVAAKSYVISGSQRSIANRVLEGTLGALGRPATKWFEVIDTGSGAATIEDLSINTLRVRSGNGQHYRIDRYLRTGVFLEQVLALICCIEERQIEGRVAEKLINDVIQDPSVYSFRKLMRGSQTLLVDTHASYRGYFQAMSATSYSKAALIIASLNFVEEDPAQNISAIVRCFSRFDAVVIANDLRKYFKHSPSSARMSQRRGILDSVESCDTVIVHDPAGSLDLETSYNK